MRLFATVLTICALSSCVFVLNDRERARVERSYSFDGSTIRLIEVRSYNGSITLGALPAGETEVRCQARFYATGSSVAEAEDRLTEMTVAESRSDGVLRLEVPRHSVLGTNNVGASLSLQLPAGIEVDLHSSNGNVQFSAPFAKPVVRTSNGNVELRASSGPIKVRTSNGRVIVDDLSSPSTVEVKSSNGGIEYEGPSRDFELVTSNGSVQVKLPDGWDGKGYIHSSNGSVHISCAGTLDSKLSVETSNGKKQVSGPELSGEGSLTVETSNASVQVTHGR